MKTSHKKEDTSLEGQPTPNGGEVTVRGSGYTYTEEEERTDKSIRLTELKDNEEVIPPKDLGKKSRP